jgi:hypothetical protein
MTPCGSALSHRLKGKAASTEVDTIGHFFAMSLLGLSTPSQTTKNDKRALFVVQYYK